MSKDPGAFEALLTENRRFRPSPEFTARAVVGDEELYSAAQADREAYWAEWAESLHWFRRWDSVRMTLRSTRRVERFAGSASAGPKRPSKSCASSGRRNM